MLTAFVVARVEANRASRQPQPRLPYRPDRLIRAVPLPRAKLATLLQQKPFLPGRTYAGLLDDIATAQLAKEEELFQDRLKYYNKLGWFRKLFCEKPRRQDILVQDIPFSTMEQRYQGRASQFELFNALCELREHRLILLDTTHPYRVGMTATGWGVHRLVQDNKLELPPAYEEANAPGL